MEVVNNHVDTIDENADENIMNDKNIMNDENIMIDENMIDENIMNDKIIAALLKEAEIVDSDAEVKADDDIVQYHLYAIKGEYTGDNTVAHKVMQICDNHRENDTVQVLASINNTVQILTSPYNNGRFYLLGNDITEESVRAITLRVTELQNSKKIQTIKNIKTKLFYILVLHFSFFIVNFLFETI